jgi:hypothetical protein
MNDRLNFKLRTLTKQRKYSFERTKKYTQERVDKNTCILMYTCILLVC